ncbi:MAG: hypothetical protein AAF500_00405 [Myxococcota bacterium]
MRWYRGAIVLVALGLGACGDASSDGTGGIGGDPSSAEVYAISSRLAFPGGSATYVSILSSLDPSDDELDLANAYEFPALSDMWSLDGYVYVSSGESPTITRYRVTEGRELEEDIALSFANFGVPSTAFASNVIVDESRAFVANGPRELVVWDPSAMEITGTFALPELESRDGLIPTYGDGDRGSVIHEGRLYQTVFWTDLRLAFRDAASAVLVFDLASQDLIAVIDAPCPGLAYGTVGETGNVYFSPWYRGVGAALVLDVAATCTVVVDPDTLSVADVLPFADLAGGREGSGMRHLGNGRFAFSAFDDDEVDLETAIADGDPFTILDTASWRLWSYDADTGATEPLAAINRRGGAVYWFDIDGKPYALAPSSDYIESSVYALEEDGTTAKPLFTYSGWAVRLFRIR